MSDDPQDGIESAILSDCRRLSRALEGFLDAAAQALGVGPSDVRALARLRQGPMAPTDLARALRLTRPSVTVLLDRLERAGLVERRPEEWDRRAVTVLLTPQKRDAVARVLSPLDDHLRDAVQSVPEHDRDAVADALQRLADAAEDATRTIMPRG